MPNRGKTICFIDNSNIFGGQIASGWRIDWRKFQNKMEKRGELWQTYFFASIEDPPNPKQQEFYNTLKENMRWEVVIYTLKPKTMYCPNCKNTGYGHVEKGVDVGLATKMLMLAFNRAYDTALLVTGDSDYLETVNFIKNLGLRVEIVGWRRSMSTELGCESSSAVQYLDDMEDEIKINYE